MVRDRDEKGEASGSVKRPRALSLTFSLGNEAHDAILRSTEAGLYDAFIRGSLFLEFDGVSPLRPGTDPRAIQGGAISEVPILTFLWALAASVSRLMRRVSSSESVGITSTAYALAFNREGDSIRTRLMRETAEGEWVQVAETRTTAIDVGREVANALGTLLAGISDRNPILKGNLQVKRISDTVAELEKLLGEVNA